VKRVICIFFALVLMVFCFCAGVSAAPASASLLFSAESETPPAVDIEPEIVITPDPPVVTYTDLPVSTYVEVLISSADGAVLPDGWKICYSRDNSQWFDYTGELAVDINGPFFAKIISDEGVESAVTEATITCIDKTPPTPPEILADTTTWTSDFVDVSVVSGTDAESGIVRREYRLGETGQWLEYSAPVQITSPVVFYARSVDAAGNYSTLSSLDINNFDFTPPDITSLYASFSSNTPPILTDTGIFRQYYRDNVQVSIDGALDSQSGLRGYQYQFVGSGNPLTDDGWLEYDPTALPVIGGNFCGYVCVRAIDNTGNISPVFTSENLVVDTEAPVIGKINFSTTEITDNRVVVTFNITDNIWLDKVMVGSNYLGTYEPTFTVFRNGDYTVTATDKAGNTATATFSVKNIDSTPFSLLSVFNQLDEDSFTPSTWVKAAAAADELQRLLTVETNSEKIASATEKLVSSMEALVSRGDGTMSLELINRVLEYDKTKYTESSWLRVEVCIADIRLCLDDPESTQADVDNARRTLEQAVSELALLGNFSSLDRLIKQCESIGAEGYDPVKYAAFTAALDAAKSLSRSDSAQADVDAAYVTLLKAMEAMKIPEIEEKASIPLVGYVIIGLLVIFTLTVLFIIFKSSSDRANVAVPDDSADGEQEDPAFDVHPNIGDICFSDDDEND